jgi:hypothetical protein
MNKKYYPSIKRVVSAFMKVGKQFGYFNAEMILMKYLPDNKPDGKCSDVEKKKRAALIAALNRFGK